MELELQPPDWATHVISDLTDWRRSPLPVDQLEPLQLPDDVYFEYAFLDGDGEPRPDPENPYPARNHWWPYARSITGPKYRPDPYAEIGRARPAGQVRRLTVNSVLLGQNRRVLVYTPPGYAGQALPTIYFQDGKAYYGWGQAPQILDRLLVEKAVLPAHLVFVTPLERAREYARDETYLLFLLEELLPLVETEAPSDNHRIAMGASLGGLLSGRLAWSHPELFQTVVAQSGAFLTSPGEEIGDPFHGSEWMRREVLSRVPRPLRWYLDCGTLEWLLPSNDRLATALQERGYELEYRRRNAGHNWVNWRNGLADALRFALAP
ncbi:MAG: alpha/beta hydrolase-fold protein [bacterium]